jgi:hypothetical protein
MAATPPATLNPGVLMIYAEGGAIQARTGELNARSRPLAANGAILVDVHAIFDTIKVRE